MNHPLLEITDFSFLIGAKKILNGISLAVREGDFLSIIGPNGAGKTTLLKCIMRILTGGHGEIRLAGRNLEIFSQKELASWLSYVPQGVEILPAFTVLEFVRMGRYPHLSPFSTFTQTDEAAVERSLSLTGMEPFAHRYLNTLSGGERQQAYIAAALAQEAKVLLLDEPTAFLDPRHQVEVLATLKRLNRETGLTIIAITHDINSALLSDGEILAIKEGKDVYQGPAGGILSADKLENIYGTGFLKLQDSRLPQFLVLPEGLL
ncbi:MAG: ABC transporter ATP-binding protein [Planctomycetes bacterium]|nr:ABC transporter ATP-binding protein [Planctomycetota bacterium]